MSPARPVTCKQGHLYDEKNTYIKANGGYLRRACARYRANKYYAKRKMENQGKRKQELLKFTPNLSDVELSWAAGLFEGEGTVTITSGGRHGYTRLYVVIGMTDREAIGFFQQRWVTPSLGIHQPAGNARPVYTWRLSCQRAAIFLEQILPFVRTTRVREKILLALESQNARVQGIRLSLDEYNEAHQDFRERMRILNKRGAS